MNEPRRVRVEPMREGAAVTPLELFFDLVFVFALTQVTAFMAEHLTAHGVLRGMLVAGLLWWSWVNYAWLGNVARADEGVVRTGMFAAMGVMFLIALTIPEAFDDLPGGLHGPTVIPVCYFLFRALHIGLFWVVARGDKGLRGQLLRFLPSMLAATALLLVAAQFDGWVQTGLWALVLVADYGGNLVGGARGWRLRSAGHFAERHGLILIVALGESIVAIGVGIAKLPISWPIVAGALLGLVVSAALWWSYFDVTARMAEHALIETPEETRPRVARDAYSYLHFPMVAGVVLLSLGLKKILEYVGDGEHHHLEDPLKGVALYALFGGVMVTLLAYVAFKWLMTRQLGIPRLVTVAVLLALVPLAALIPAILALTALAVVLVLLITYETVRYAAIRYDVRHSS